jgi:UV DNA damage endonuclease
MSIGYVCQVIGVPGTHLSRCILKNATETNIRLIFTKNMSALEAMLEYNAANHIKLFRISSDIVPFGSHPMNQIRWWEEYRELFDQLGQKIIRAGIRVSMHPGQYTVLNSPDTTIVENAIRDLEYHERFLSSLGMDQTSKLVLHIGGVYGDKKKAIKTFQQNYKLLSQEIKNRLIIENDDKNYNIQDVLNISAECKIPVVYDNLHHWINPPDRMEHSEFDWITLSGRTWSAKDGKQKVHYSQQKETGSPGSHSDTIYVDPFLAFYHSLPDKNIDIMLEVKDKNLSAIKCNHTVKQTTAKGLEAEWERYKYYVLSKSGRLYEDISELLKEKAINANMDFYHSIETALALPEDKATQVNAARHIWGIVNNDCTKTEKNRYDKLMEAYASDIGGIQAVKNHVLKCAESRGLNDLINSLYFYMR